MTIEERSGWFGSDYDIQTPTSIFTARNKRALFHRGFELIAEDGTNAGFIEPEDSFWGDRFVFRMPDENVYHFAREKFWSQVYLCMGESAPYRFYTRESTIFKDNQQIATIQKRIRFWKGALYEINMSSEADSLVVACMVILAHTIAQAADDVIIVD